MVRRIFFLIPIFIVGCWFIIHSCKESGTSPTENEYVMPDSNIVYQSKYDSVHDISGLLTLKCGSWDGCHSAIEPANGLELAISCSMIKSQLVQDGRNLIWPKEPESSILYIRLFPDNPEGEQMPRGGPYLTDNQINAVRIWIEDDCPCDEDELSK